MMDYDLVGMVRLVRYDEDLEHCILKEQLELTPSKSYGLYTGLESLELREGIDNGLLRVKDKTVLSIAREQDWEPYLGTNIKYDQHMQNIWAQYMQMREDSFDTRRELEKLRLLEKAKEDKSGDIPMMVDTSSNDEIFIPDRLIKDDYCQKYR